MHTNYSPDSEGDIEVYLHQAKSMGLSYVLFTDHADFGTADKNFIKKIDYDEYFSKMKDLQIKFDTPIKVGIEVGYGI